VVRTVGVAIQRVVRGGCRYLDRFGHLGRRQSCNSNSLFLAVRGTTRWSLRLTGRFVTGPWALRFRVYDLARNTGRPPPVRFRIR
jgi:hypothetical protein